MRTREEVSSRGEMNARRDERTNAPRTVPHRAKPHAAGSSAPSPLGSVNKNTRPQNASVGYIVRSSVKCESNTTVSATAAPAGDASAPPPAVPPAVPPPPSSPRFVFPTRARRYASQRVRTTKKNA
eukprot:30780-Pelagococcus_subviridis.AAC.4